MATPAQIAANRINASHSTGPVTPEGKARASQNSTRFGLFAKRDCVPPACREEYELLREGFFAELVPANAAESVLVNEIVSAAWRLERCAQADASLDSSISFLDHLPTIAAIGRARAAAMRVMSQATAELRKLQTERCSRADTIDPDELGIASIAGVLQVFAKRDEAMERERKRQLSDLVRNLETKTPPVEHRQQSEADSTTETQSETVPIARNAECPCGSGEKFKRCCGVAAPPVLSFRSAA